MDTAQRSAVLPPPVVPPPTVLVPLAEWFEAAACWRAGDPFPLIACPALDRYERLFAERELPAVGTRAWPGTVLSVGSSRSAVLAGVLARATGRECGEVAPGSVREVLAGLGDSYAAVVGLLADIDA